MAIKVGQISCNGTKSVLISNELYSLINVTLSIHFDFQDVIEATRSPFREMLPMSIEKMQFT